MPSVGLEPLNPWLLYTYKFTRSFIKRALRRGCYNISGRYPIPKTSPICTATRPGQAVCSCPGKRVRKAHFTIVRGGTSGRGKLFVDIKLKVLPQHKLRILMHNYYFFVHKRLSTTRWTTLYYTNCNSPLLFIGQTGEFGLEGGENWAQVVGGAQEARDVRERHQHPLEPAKSAHVPEH